MLRSQTGIIAFYFRPVLEDQISGIVQEHHALSRAGFTALLPDCFFSSASNHGTKRSQSVGTAAGLVCLHGCCGRPVERSMGADQILCV